MILEGLTALILQVPVVLPTPVTLSTDLKPVTEQVTNTKGETGTFTRTGYAIGLVPVDDLGVPLSGVWIPTAVKPTNALPDTLVVGGVSMFVVTIDAATLEFLVYMDPKPATQKYRFAMAWLGYLDSPSNTLGSPWTVTGDVFTYDGTAKTINVWLSVVRAASAPRMVTFRP